MEQVTGPLETQPRREPMLNVPPLTLAVAGVLGLCFAVLQNGAWAAFWVPLLSFVPVEFSAVPMAASWTVLSYALLHFGWAHIAMNVTGLLAFGSGVERMLGRLWFAGVLIGGTVVGALGHWALFPDSAVPLGGASAGISALFGAALPLLMKRRDLVVACVFFILTNIVLGEMLGDDGMEIAWQAHIFGFGFGLTCGLVFRSAGRAKPGISSGNNG